jgi:protease-4
VAQQAEYLADRQRLKRRLRLWRAGAVLAVIVTVLLLIFDTDGPGAGLIKRDQIARVSITGLITDSASQQKLLDQLAKADHVKAVILRINSPGGTTAGAEALFAAIRRIARKKPVVAVLGTVAASGGYIAAIGADHIVARGNTITGSIGVIVQWAQVSALLEKLGVKMETVKSAPLKGEPSPFTATTPEGRAAIEKLVRDSYDWFIALVADRRNLSADNARALADGRVFTGRLAVDNKLVDRIGGEPAARAWLTDTKKVPARLKIINWREPRGGDFGLGVSLIAALARSFGFTELSQSLTLAGKALKPERLSLDGLVSVWQPER